MRAPTADWGAERMADQGQISNSDGLQAEEDSDFISRFGIPIRQLLRLPISQPRGR